MLQKETFNPLISTYIITQPNCWNNDLLFFHIHDVMNKHLHHTFVISYLLNVKSTYVSL